MYIVHVFTIKANHINLGFSKMCTCGSERFMSLKLGRTDVEIWLDNQCYSDENGYLPKDVNLGEGRNLYLDICAECGKVPGKWPLVPRAHLIAIEKEREEESKREKEDLEHFETFLKEQEYHKKLKKEREELERTQEHNTYTPISEMSIPKVSVMSFGKTIL